MTQCDASLLSILACPKCRASLAQDGQALRCTRADCGLTYPIRDGIPVMLIEEATRSQAAASLSGTTADSGGPEWAGAKRQLSGGLLSIIMPAHNLGPAIAGNIRHVDSLFRGKIPFEIIVVDDGSQDETGRELDRMARELTTLLPVHLLRNVGKGAALKRGFEASTGSFVLLLDGDLDLPPSQVLGFFDIMEKARADAVIGSKMHPESNVASYPWKRRMISLTYYGLVKMLVGLPVRDTQTGIKLFKRAALEWAFPRLLVKHYAFDLELLALVHSQGFRIAESPITLRAQGKWGMPAPTTIHQVIHDTLAIFYRLRILRYYQTIRDTHMPEPPPLVSVVIALPSPTAYLEECLFALSQQSYSNYEVILLPDEPTGRRWPDKVAEVPTGRIRPAEKRNLGIARAHGEIVAFLDDDTTPAENWLQQAVVYFSNTDVAAVGGPATTPGNDPYLAKLGGRVYSNRLVSGSYRYRYEPTRVQDVDDYPSCNLLVRTSSLRELGGFRTDFWPGEDTYLCMDIVTKLQKKIVYDPRVHVFHHRRPLFLPHLRQIGRYALHRGYFARHFPTTSRRLSYALPSLFVLGLAFGAVACGIWPVLRMPYLAAVSLYALLTLLSCASLNPATWVLTWIGVVLTHITYGARFLGGLVTSRLPGQVEEFDHPSERHIHPEQTTR